jgi:hypothetical protein
VDAVNAVDALKLDAVHPVLDALHPVLVGVDAVHPLHPVHPVLVTPYIFI